MYKVQINSRPTAMCQKRIYSSGAEKRKKKKKLGATALTMKLESLPKLLQAKMTAFELITHLSLNDICGLYPNFWIALRITCPLPVTAASAERSFSKLNLTKTYLRSTMAQERLSGLAIISANNKTGDKITYNDVINDFASRKARKQRL